MPTLGPALALLGFMAGAALGGRVLKSAEDAWPRRVTALLAGVAAVMLVLSAVLFAVGEDPAHGLMVAVTTGAAVAMGLQAATARHVAVKDVTTVVVTSTITALAADSLLGGGSGVRSGRRLLAVALILMGATVGALLLKVHLGAGLLLAGVVIAAVAVVGELHPGDAGTAAP